MIDNYHVLPINLMIAKHHHHCYSIKSCCTVLAGSEFTVAVQGSLEFAILVPLDPECWDQKHGTRC